MMKHDPQQTLDLWSAVYVASDALAPKQEPQPKPKRPLTLDERFQAYHEAHPDIYAEFKRVATQLLERGRTHYGAGAIFEFIRFQRDLYGGRDTEPYKINNDYRSRYTRKLIADDPRFSSFFAVRKLHS